MESIGEAVRRVLEAVEPRDGGLFVNVIGPRGSGKTRTVLSQLREFSARSNVSRKRRRNATELLVAYASCCSFGDDPRSLRRVVLEQLSARCPSTTSDDEARTTAKRKPQKPLDAASAAAFGCALASLLALASPGIDSAGDPTPLLHIILDDADALRDDTLSDITNWLPALENARWEESKRAVIWILSTKSVSISKGRVWRLYAPAPPAALAAEWYNPASEASRPSSVPKLGVSGEGEEVAQDAVTAVRRSAFRFFLEHRPFRDSIVCKDLKRLRNFVTESVLSRLYGGISATSANAPVALESAFNQAGAGASALRSTRSDSGGAEYLFRSLWSEEVVKQAGTLPSADGALFQLLPFSAQVLLVTCFYCSAVPAAKDKAVLSEAERTGLLSSRAKRAQLRTVGRGALASQTVPLVRLRKCYEAIEIIAQHAVAHNQESCGTPVDPILGAPSTVSFAVAQHHLTAFERLGLVQWLSNHRTAIHCRISSQTAEVVATRIGIDIYQLVPNALTA